MADDNLYQIDLDPGTGGVYSVPNASSPNGSIGGSDVGANEEDDQRVRDLMEQHLPDLGDMLIEITNNNSNPAGDILTLYNNGMFVFNPDGTTDSQYVGTIEQCEQHFPGVPMLVHFSANIIVNWQDELTINDEFWLVLARIYVDGTHWATIPVSQVFKANATAAASQMQLSITEDWVLNAGVDLIGVFGGLENPLQPNTFTATQQAVAFAAGSHVIRVDWSVQFSDFFTTLVSAQVRVSRQLLNFRRVANLGCFLEGGTGE